jgi:hypothetical protein
MIVEDWVKRTNRTFGRITRVALLQSFQFSPARTSTFNKSSMKVKTLRVLRTSSLIQESRNFVFSINVDLYHLEDNLVACIEDRLHSDEIQCLVLHELPTITTWNLGAISVVTKRQRNSEDTLVGTGDRRNFLFHTDTKVYGISLIFS